MAMIDLKDRAGDRYRITLDPSAALDPSHEERPWFYRVPGRKGTETFNFIGVHGANELFITSNRSGLFRRLIAIPGSSIRQQGQSEISVVFAPEHLDLAAAIIQAQRRRRLSPEARAAWVARGESTRFAGARTDLGGLKGGSEELA
jgi:hypothetical protein